MKADKVYQLLNDLSIPYEIIEHKAALTVEEWNKCCLKWMHKYVKTYF